MGGTITLTPNGTANSTGWSNIGGAASIHAALADASDATYATDTTPGSGNTWLTLDLTDATAALPAGAAIKSVTPVVRVSQAVGYQGLKVYVYRDGGYFLTHYKSPEANIGWPVPSAIQTHTMPAAGALNKPSRTDGYFGDDSHFAIIEQLQLHIFVDPPAAATEDHRIYMARADVVYIDAPSATGLGLVDVLDLQKTAKPRFKWTFTADEGLPQYEFRTAVWALADINAFTGGRAAFEANMNNIFGDTTGSAGTYGPGFTDGAAVKRYAKAWSKPAGQYYAGYTQSSLAAWTPEQNIPGTGAHVCYVQVAAQYEGGRLEKPAAAVFDFTMNLTPPVAPTSATAVWQYPGASAPNNIDQYRTKVDVAVPALVDYAGFTGRRVYVEHAIEGTEDWKLLPLGMQSTTLAAATFTFYDTMPIPDRIMKYRAKTEFWDSTYTLPSATWTLAPTPVTCVFDNFVLRDPLDPAGAVVLRIQGDLEITQSEVVGEYRPLGASRATYISDQITGRRFRVPVHAGSPATMTALQKLRSARRALLLQGDMADWWAWVRFAPDVQRRVLRQPNRRAARQEMMDMELLETYPIPGQPITWE